MTNVRVDPLGYSFLVAILASCRGHWNNRKRFHRYRECRSDRIQSCRVNTFTLFGSTDRARGTVSLSGELLLRPAHPFAREFDLIAVSFDSPCHSKISSAIIVQNRGIRQIGRPTHGEKIDF